LPGLIKGIDHPLNLRTFRWPELVQEVGVLLVRHFCRQPARKRITRLEHLPDQPLRIVLAQLPRFLNGFLKDRLDLRVILIYGSVLHALAERRQLREVRA
jgi:hypothetical protein